MIVCPTCNSNSVSVVTAIETRKTSSALLDAIQIVCTIGVLFSGFMLAATLFTDTDSVLNALSSALSLHGSEAIKGDVFRGIVRVYLSFGIFKWCGIGYLISTLLKRLLPYRTTSHEKCICHYCQSQWKYAPYPFPPNNG